MVIPRLSWQKVMIFAQFLRLLLQKFYLIHEYHSLRIKKEREIWCLSVSLTNDNRLGFTLHSNPCTCAGSHFHMVHYSYLQPTHHYRAYGCIHCLINMETRLIPKTPDLKWKRTKISDVFRFVWLKWESMLTCWDQPCTLGWCRSGDRVAGGPRRCLWKCCSGFQRSELLPAEEGHWELKEEVQVSWSIVKYTIHQLRQRESKQKRGCTSQTHIFVRPDIL